MNWSRSFAVLASLTALAATPAAAQPYPAEPYYGVVSPREVMRTVADMGLQPASEPRLRGHVWVVRGIGREGTMVRVVIDSHSGQVVDMRALRGPAAYEAGPYEPDPRYVMRERQPYGSDGYPPAPRAGEVYRAPVDSGPGRAVAPDEEDYDGQPPVPPGYVGPRSAYPPAMEPRFSSTPEPKRVAAKPPSVPLPKARPDNIQGNVKVEAAKKENVKKDAPKADVAKQEEPKPDEAKKAETKKDEVKKDEAKKEDESKKDEQASTPLTSPKDPETTAAIAKAHSKAQTEAKKPETPQSEPKKVELPPVQPLE